MTKQQILLIEPDAVLAKTYASALDRAKFSVRHASSAQAAIHAIDKQIPDLIILELQIAAHNGVEFMYELRSYPEWQAIPVIVLSSVPQAESGINEQTAQKLGLVGYAYKSQTSLKKLIEIVQSGLAT